MNRAPYCDKCKIIMKKTDRQPPANSNEYIDSTDEASTYSSPYPPSGTGMPLHPDSEEKGFYIKIDLYFCTKCGWEKQIIV